MFGAIEAGGTKFVCGVSEEGTIITDKTIIKTTEPAETMKAVFAFFDQYPIGSLGIGSFGPIGINKAKDNYGYILRTPKKGWTNFDLLGVCKDHFNCPIAFTTDVNVAAYGEYRLGAGVGTKNCVYLTIGTGIGGGIISNGKIFQGITHPEIGHMMVKRHPDDHYDGFCPYHGDCLEGLAAGPSLLGRTGIKGESIPEDHPIWDLQAYYIGQALMTYTLILAPERIILGGGVMNQDFLIEKIRNEFVRQTAGYVTYPNVNDYIVKWGLPNQSGLLGALLLAKEEGTGLGDTHLSNKVGKDKK